MSDEPTEGKSLDEAAKEVYMAAKKESPFEIGDEVVIKGRLFKISWIKRNRIMLKLVRK